MQSESIDTSVAGQPASAIRLAAGQCLRIHVAAGAVLRATTGEIAVSGPPQWLAETCHVPHWRLRSGDTLAMPVRGWLQVTAHGGAVFAIATPPGLLARLATMPGWRKRRALTPGVAAPAGKPQRIADLVPEKL